MQTTKGYWVIECQEMSNQDAMQKYASAWSKIAKEFNAKIIAGGRSAQFVEGQKKTRVLILEFPSYQIALDCYYSDKYQEAKNFALNAMERTFSIVEGELAI